MTSEAHRIVAAGTKDHVVNAVATVYRTYEYPGDERPTYYFSCHTCGNNSRRFGTQDAERIVVGAAREHVKIDHSRYHPNYGDHTHV